MAIQCHHMLMWSTNAVQSPEIECIPPKLKNFRHHWAVVAYHPRAFNRHLWNAYCALGSVHSQQAQAHWFSSSRNMQPLRRYLGGMIAYRTPRGFWEREWVASWRWPSAPAQRTSNKDLGWKLSWPLRQGLGWPWSGQRTHSQKAKLICSRCQVKSTPERNVFKNKEGGGEKEA